MAYRHMPLRIPIHGMSILTPYEVMLLLIFYHIGILIMEQGIGEQTPFICLQYIQCLTAIIPKRDRYANNSTLKSAQIRPRTQQITITVKYIIHCSTNHIEFSTEVYNR
jgi:hypothetical protein